jgi:formamidopyrimidine-DNA glycosylase
VPELPEVETVVRSLRPKLRAAKLGPVWWSGLPLHLLRPPDVKAIQRICAGTRVSDVRRRAKYILIDVEARGRSRGGVVVHLGMTGQLRVVPADAPRVAHTHLVWPLGGGRELRFVDPRRFGWVMAGDVLDELPELQGLGPDPLEQLDAPALAASLAASRAPIKAFLLDQRRVAGLGNIYVSEALFRAGVHPVTPARRARKRAAALVEAIRAVLEQGINNRGTTLRDYVDADGMTGGNSSALQVYGREGEPCVACAAPIVRRVDAGRSTFFCARCQRR